MRSLYRISSGKLLPTIDPAAPVIVFTDPDEADKKELLEKLGIDRHTLLSALDPDEPSRFEPAEAGHLALIFKLPRHRSETDPFLFKVASMGLFLYRDKLVVVFPREEPFFEDKMFGHVDAPSDALLQILSVSVDRYLEHLKAIDKISEEIEAKINVSMENSYLLNLFSLEKSLVYYVNALDSDGLVLGRLEAFAEKTGFSDKNRQLLEDVLIENAQCRRQAEIYTQVLSNMMDARVSIVNNNLSMLMKTLNFITIMLMVPTLVVSVFSMNVTLPFQRHPQAFWGVAVLSSAALGVFMVVWKKALKDMKGGAR